MFDPYNFYQHPGKYLLGIAVAIIWSLIWKGIALWYSARNQQKKWFVAILVVNSLGLLPIIYLLWFKPANRIKVEKTSKTKTKRRR